MTNDMGRLAEQEQAHVSKTKRVEELTRRITLQRRQRLPRADRLNAAGAVVPSGAEKTLDRKFNAVHNLVTEMGSITLTLDTLWDDAPRVEFGVEFDLTVLGSRLNGNRDLEFRLDRDDILQHVVSSGQLNLYETAHLHATPQKKAIADGLIVRTVTTWVNRNRDKLPMDELRARLERSEDMSRSASA